MGDKNHQKSEKETEDTNLKTVLTGSNAYLHIYIFSKKIIALGSLWTLTNKEIHMQNRV
jgi:hypothetical protein